MQHDAQPVPHEPVPHEPVPHEPVPHEPWYRYGLACLCLEMLLAVAVSAYSLYVTVHGIGGFSATH